MQIGLFGLGKMGRALAGKWIAAGHTVIGADPNLTASEAASRIGVTAVASATACVTRLANPRVLWMMVPWDRVDGTLDEVKGLLAQHDILIDGGNSPFQEASRRATQCAEHGAAFLDVGVSGGPSGAATGFSLMIGGDAAVALPLEPLFAPLAAPHGAFAYLGPSGAGHFVKMIHNGVEYGMMEALAEGIDLLAHGPYPNLPFADIGRVWQRGSVIRSYLVDLLADILANEDLARVRGRAGATGEGKWTVETARVHGIAVPAIATAVRRREESQQHEYFAAKIVALLRERFGGHAAERNET